MANQKIVTDEALSAFASDVKAEIANVSSPLAYKGTLGTGGTISTLPAASASNKGFAYVVITAGTYQGVVCAVSDVIASNGTAWNIIPQANSAETLPITTGSAVNTKEYIDDKTTLVKSASGSLIHITDGADNIPVKSLTSEIVAVESGSGEKSPDNPYTISGFDSGVITRCGVNLCDEVFETGDISFATGGNITGASWIRSKNYVPIVSGLTIYVKSAQNINIFFYDYNKAYLGNNSEGLKSNIKNTEITISSKVRYFRIATNQTPYNHDISINYPSSDTSYHAYNGNTYTFTFGQTVYGGHFDNKGNLVVTHGYIASYNGESINEPWISSMDNYVPNTSPSTGAQVVYPLTTPNTLSITSQDIPTLLGENNIFSNTGDVEVNYYVDTEAIYAIRDVIDEFAMQSDWNEADNTKADYIKNKPTIPANADFSLSGLSDTDISSPSAGQVLTFDGDNWVNSNIVLPSVKYKEINVTFDASGEGTLFNSVKFVVGLKDIPSDQLYVGYVSYIAGSTIKIKALSRTAIAFSSQNNVSSTRKVGVYYLDNIATQ